MLFRSNALRNLAANDANEVRIAAEGGVGAIDTAMQHHPTNAEVQEGACLALYNLTSNADNRVKVKSAGAEDAVKRAMALQDATAETKEKGQKLLDRLKNVSAATFTLQDPHQQTFDCPGN